MPTCMARGLCTSRLNPTSRPPVASFLEKCHFKNSTLAGTGAGQLLSWQTLQRTSDSVKSFSPCVVRAEGPGNSRPSTTSSTVVKDKTEAELKSEADALVDGMTFSELCNEFECISSPAVEKTARQLARDLLELREEKRTLSTYAVFVNYKDPLRSFKGREKFKRRSWIKATLNNPTVAVQQMAMISTSMLKIRWTLRGTPKLPPASVIGGELVLSVNSVYTLNQISGQVTDQVDEWDLTGSSPITLAYFYATRLAYSTVEAGKDAGESAKGLAASMNKKDDEGSNIYSDPTDPRKFFQVDDNPQKDIYQVGFLIALIYLLVQFLKLTL